MIKDRLDAFYLFVRHCDDVLVTFFRVVVDSPALFERLKSKCT
jgi:hypothetical protein